MGFRGEALPAIASVSEMTLRTRERGADAGIQVQVSAGTIKSVSETGLPPGADIAVRRLFFNVPARRKFLKSIDTELGHISTLLSNMALARPEVHLTLIHNGDTLFDLPGSPDLGGRLRQALGADAVKNLIAADRRLEAMPGGPLHVHGFVSLPSYTRSSTRSLHLYVNRRFVRDRVVSHAVFEAYRTLIPRGRFPLVVLFLDLPPEAVDVNVHPAKHEVRFREQALVHQCVLEAVLGALRPGGRPEAFVTREPAADFRPAAWVEGMAAAGEGRSSGEEAEVQRRVAAALSRYEERTAGDSGPERDRSYPPPAPSYPREDSGGPPYAGALPEPVPPGLRFAELRVLGQVAKTFILAEGDDDLYVIDQHAAHERVTFERLRRQYRQEAVLRQPYLFPMTIELTFSEARRVERRRETLLRLGLEVEPFGGNTVAVKALPALLAGADPGRLLLEVVDRLGEEADADLAERLDQVFSVMACHSVVRANQSLSMEEMQALLRAMDEADFPGHCPHGRETVVRLSRRRMEKWFGR
jgi:DNA mismatch repair protein MutL